MQKLFKRISSVLIAIVMCLGITVIAHTLSSEYVVADAVTAENYYDDITATGGTQLLGQLHDLITTTHKKYTSYDDCKNPDYVKVTDPGSSSAYVKEFYSQEDISSTWGSGAVGTWNREHVWCQSLSNGLWGESGGGADMHHIRPSESQVNSTRGNNKFGIATGGKEVKYAAKSATAGYVISNTVFEPINAVKGDVARIVMYVYTHYNNYSNVHGTTNGSGSGKFGTLHFDDVMYANNENAAIQMLLEWNRLDPVDESERIRNDEVFEIQGNRNPFIDNQDYAEAIWGNGSVTPNPGGDTTPTLTGLTISPSSLNLKVGESENLTVTATPSTASNSVSWSTSNSTVASVSNGTVTAKSEGTATITATSTQNTSIKSSITVTVSKTSTTPPSPIPGGSTITISRSSFTASGNYGAYNWTSGGISGSGYIYAGEGKMIQLNSSKSSHYIASSTATSAPIASVKMTLNSDKHKDGGKDWQLFTSNSAYSSYTTGNPKGDKDQGTETATKDGAVWTVSGNYTYFALVYEGSGAVYVDSIEVTLASEGGGGTDTPVTPPDPTVTLESLALNHTDIEFAVGNTVKLQAIPTPSNASAEVIWTSSNSSVASVSADGTVTAVAAGTATITATSVDNPAISVSTTVTVKANDTPVTPNPGSGSTDDFYNAIAAVEGTLAERRAAIINAINAYNALSAEDKAAVKALLDRRIEEYNRDVQAYNEKAEDADNAALRGVLR